MKWSRKLWLRLNPDRPKLILKFGDGTLVCPICERAMPVFSRRRGIYLKGSPWIPQRANAERHLDACFDKQQREIEAEERA